MANKGVRVKWDMGDENVYRYGADDCYDVCEWRLFHAARTRCVAKTIVPSTVSRTRARVGVVAVCDVAFWSRYVTHYLRGGLYKSKGLFAPHISRQELIKMLPDYEVEGARDRRRGEGVSRSGLRAGVAARDQRGHRGGGDGGSRGLSAGVSRRPSSVTTSTRTPSSFLRREPPPLSRRSSSPSSSTCFRRPTATATARAARAPFCRATCRRCSARACAC